MARAFVLPMRSAPSSARAAAHDGRVVIIGQLTLFSSATGDAWLLDRDHHLALRLARHGDPEPFHIEETDTSFAIDWKGHYHQGREIELARRMIDVEAYDLSFGVEIDIEPGRHFAGFRARLGLQLDIEAVGFRIIVKLHRSAHRKLRSKKALWIVSPSARVTTRNIRSFPSRVSPTAPQWPIRPSS